MATDDILGQLPDLPPKLRYPFVVEYLIERHLLAQYAVKEGIADTEEYKHRLALYQAKALRDAYFFQKIRPMVTEEEMKVYDDEAAKLQQTERVRARMILVATEKEAKDILARLAKGEKFEDLAKQFSLDGSKDYGGDLGYFTAARNGAGILQGSIRAEGRRDIAAGEDRFRLAHHPPRGPQAGGRPALRPGEAGHPQRAAAQEGRRGDGEDPRRLQGRDRRRGPEEICRGGRQGRQGLPGKASRSSWTRPAAPWRRGGRRQHRRASGKGDLQDPEQ